jgi:hypothetical protein
MAFFIPSIQFFFGLPRALLCFGIHFSAILGNLQAKKKGHCRAFSHSPPACINSRGAMLVKLSASEVMQDNEPKSEHLLQNEMNKPVIQ